MTSPPTTAWKSNQLQRTFDSGHASDNAGAVYRCSCGRMFQTSKGLKIHGRRMAVSLGVNSVLLQVSRQIKRRASPGRMPTVSCVLRVHLQVPVHQDQGSNSRRAEERQLGMS